MRRTISEKVLNKQQKEEKVINKKTQIEILKEEYDKKLNQKNYNIQERVR